MRHTESARQRAQSLSEFSLKTHREDKKEIYAQTEGRREIETEIETEIEGGREGQTGELGSPDGLRAAAPTLSPTGVHGQADEEKYPYENLVLFGRSRGGVSGGVFIFR